MTEMPFEPDPTLNDPTFEVTVDDWLPEDSWDTADDWTEDSSTWAEDPGSPHDAPEPTFGSRVNEDGEPVEWSHTEQKYFNEQTWEDEDPWQVNWEES